MQQPDVNNEAPLVVIAIGGNSLIPDGDHESVQDQYAAAAETDDHIASLVGQGWDVAISHGNGPQVGFILRRSEMSSSELHEVPLDFCGADTQGAIGYMLQQNLVNDFRQRGIAKGDLRPAGICEFDGRRVDVVSQGGFIDGGSEVEVIKVDGNRIVVKKA